MPPKPEPNVRSPLGAEKEAQGPTPLPDGLPPVRSLTEDMMPRVLRPWLLDICERMQVPLEFTAIPAVVAAGSILGNRIGIRPKSADSWVEFPNIWGAVVGRPGTLKTPWIQAALAPIHRLQEAAREVHKAASAEYARGRAISAARRKAAMANAVKDAKKGGEIGGAGLVDDEEPELCLRRYETNNATFAALHRLLSQNPTGSLLFCDELAGLIAQLRNPETGGEYRAFLLAAWQGATPFTWDRIERGMVHVPRACLSVLGGIQPGKIARLVRGAVEERADDDGFLQRFSLLVWPDVPAAWEFVDREPDRAAAETVYDAYEQLEESLPEVLGVEQTTEGGLFLRFNERASGEFADWLTEISRRLRAADSAKSHIMTAMAAMTVGGVVKNIRVYPPR